MLVRQDHIGVTELVTWCLKVVDTHVLADFVGIVLEIEVAVGGDFGVHVLLEEGNLF